MSCRQLLRTTIKRTDEKILKVPKRYYWIYGGVVLPVIITLGSFLLSPFLPTFTFIQLVASMLFFGVALSPTLVMTSFVSILGFLFISTLREEKRKEEEEQVKIGLREIKNTVKETLPKVLSKNDIATNIGIKSSLDLANRSYQKHDESITELKEKTAKFESNETKQNELIETILIEQQRQLDKQRMQDNKIETLERASRIKDIKIDKFRKAKNLADWRLDQIKNSPNTEKPKNIDKLKRKSAIKKWWEKLTEHSKDQK